MPTRGPWQNPNDETRNPNDESRASIRASTFVIDSGFGFRHSDLFFTVPGFSKGSEDEAGRLQGVVEILCVLD